MKPIRLALTSLALVSLTAAGAVGLSAAHSLQFDHAPGVVSATPVADLNREMVVPVRAEAANVPQIDRPDSNNGVQVTPIAPDLLRGQEFLPNPPEPRIIPAVVTASPLTATPVPDPTVQADLPPKFLIGVYR